jgi:phosphate starvation-inducible PhoH-like protein
MSSKKQIKRFNSMKFKLDDLPEVEPVTAHQEEAFKYWGDGCNIVLSGSAGTGKTFLALYLGLEEVLDKDTPYDQLIIVRSAVATREQGFQPGTKEDKEDVFTLPYRSLCSELFGVGDAWHKLKTTGVVGFETTSYIRGATWNNSIVVIDEMQNFNFHELDSVITRIGRDCRLVAAGDYYQSDFEKERERNGVLTFMNIVEHMKDFEIVQFGWEDIVRSGFVRDYIMTKEMLGVR